MKKKPNAKKDKEMCEPSKEAKFEHKIVKDARKTAKDLKSGKKSYGK